VIDSDRPGLWGRLLARLHGEVPADVLEAYRRAGAEVYALLEDFETRRLDASLQAADAWAVDAATQAALLCAWNAFALQLLGDQLVDADYDADPATAGYVPPVTAEQALAFYGQVPGWLERARRAQSNPSFALDVAVPAPLPPWAAVEPCPRAHLAAMRAATAQLRRHAAAGIAGFHIDLADPDRKKAHEQVHELLAEAEAAADYADRLWAPTVPPAIHEDIERHSKLAIDRLYLLGQLVAMPRLTLAPRPTPTPTPAAGAVPAAARASGASFDPWCLTDPDSRARWQRDRTARRAIESLWANDPDPQRTLAIQAEIDAARARGDIAAATRNGRPLGHFYCCPWAPVYEVRRPVTIDGRTLQPMQQFTFDVSAEEMADGGAFRREVLIGQFHPTDEVDYCLPGAHHD